MKVVLRKMQRNTWMQRNDIVLVIAWDTGEGVIAQAWGSVNGKATILMEAQHAVVVNRQVVTEDGQWVGAAPGCSCNVPRSLKGFTPPTPVIA